MHALTAAMIHLHLMEIWYACDQ